MANRSVENVLSVSAHTHPDLAHQQACPLCNQGKTVPELNRASAVPDVQSGVRVGGDPTDESEHFMQCNACGQAFDMRDLAEVFYHEDPGHQPKERQ